MRQTIDEIKIYLGTSVLQAAFTAATTDIITSNAHGLVEGDLIQLTTTGTLPAGLSASTNYYVIEPTANTFEISTVRGGTAVDITDTGAGTHTFHLKGKIISVGDYRHINTSLNFISSPTMTVKFQASNQDSAPDFNAARSNTNRWDYVEIVDLKDGSTIDGNTGVACAGTADNRLFALNTDGLNWVSVVVTAWTAGKLDVRVKPFND